MNEKAEGAAAPCFTGEVKSCQECLERQGSKECVGFAEGCPLAPSPKGTPNMQPGNPDDQFLVLHKPA